MGLGEIVRENKFNMMEELAKVERRGKCNGVGEK